MSGVRPRLSHAGPATYEVVEAVRGGRLVEARAGGKIGVAGAASTVVLGVAETDAAPVGPTVTVDANGFETVNVSPLPSHTTVGFGRYPVTFSADAAFGDALVATAAGTVGPAGAAPDARTIVGYCDEPNGVVVASNPVGIANISR